MNLNPYMFSTKLMLCSLKKSVRQSKNGKYFPYDETSSIRTRTRTTGQKWMKEKINSRPSLRFFFINYIFLSIYLTVRMSVVLTAP